MTLIETLTDILATKIGVPVKLYEMSLHEANVKMDVIKQGEMPVFILVPIMPAVSKRENKAMVGRKVDIFGFMLTQAANQPTDDFNYEEVRPLIDNMGFLIDKMVNKMEDSAIMNKGLKGEDIIEYSTQETYAKLDAHMLGKQVRLKWPVIENVPC